MPNVTGGGGKEEEEVICIASQVYHNAVAAILFVRRAATSLLMETRHRRLHIENKYWIRDRYRAPVSNALYRPRFSTSYGYNPRSIPSSHLYLNNNNNNNKIEIIKFFFSYLFI